MGRDGFTVAVYPTIEDIARLNHKIIYSTGGYKDGAGQFINENSLVWVLEAIQHPVFGVDRYPTISEKAAILAWTIIDGHVFLDGNKRTGMISLKNLLRANSFSLSASNDEIKAIALRIATNSQTNYSKEQFSVWVLERMIYSPPD